MKTTLAIAVTLSAGISLTQLAHVQADDGKLGTVNFETSCKPEAQKLFNQAMLYQHSFWYRASQNAFEEVLKADPHWASPIGVSRSACSGTPTCPRRRKISPTVRS